MKKVFAIILCLCLCLTLLPAFTLTASATADAFIYVNGELLDIGGSLNVNGGTAKAEYNGGTDTLIITLDNCAIGTSGHFDGDYYGFYVKTDVTNVMVKLNGENVCESSFRIRGDASYEDGTTNILSGASGDGSLTVNGNISVEHGDVYIDACSLNITGQNTNSAYAAYFNNSVTLGHPAVKGSSRYDDAYVNIDTGRNIGMFVDGSLTVNSGNSSFTGKYYGAFVRDFGSKTIFSVNGGYTAFNGNQAGILIMSFKDLATPPISFSNGCGEFSYGVLSSRGNFYYTDAYPKAMFYSWMRPDTSDALIVQGTPGDVPTGTLGCNAMTSIFFRQMDGVYVTFDAGDFGEVQSPICYMGYGEKIGVMPVPVNTTFKSGKFNNMHFSGWYIDEGGLFDVIDENYVLTHNVTLHALWTEGQGTPFTDVKDSSWFKEAADFCYGQGLISGTGDGTKFSPNMACSRAMVVSILYRLSGSPYVWSGDNPFSDVKNNFWYTDAIIWASQSGIVSGIGGGKFAPDASITREQLASIMDRYAKFRGLRNPDAHVMLSGMLYHDVDKISSWAGSSMSWAVCCELISGKPAEPEGTFLLDPKGTASRAEFASILLRYLKMTDGALTFFVGEDFCITVPDRWQGNVVCETGEDSIGEWISLYCKAEYELSGAGRICRVVFDPGHEYFNLPHWEFIGSMLNDSYQIAYNVVHDLPTDVQANEDPASPLATRYFSMSGMRDLLTYDSNWYTFSTGVG